MTAESLRVLVDARGGGFGHAMRGACVAEALAADGHRVELGVLAESAQHLSTYVPVRHDVRQALHESFDVLVVDTFAHGFERDLDDATRARFGTCVLVARYHRTPQPFEGFDRVWAPYPSTHDEWPARLNRAEYMGWMVRHFPTEIAAGGRTFAVLDPGARVRPTLRATFERMARRAARPIVWLARWPARLEAAKILSIGAGYGTVYELGRALADVAFVPLTRRYDDQTRRAELVERAITSLDELERWLATPCQPRRLPEAGYAASTPRLV